MCVKSEGGRCLAACAVAASSGYHERSCNGLTKEERNQNLLSLVAGRFSQNAHSEREWDGVKHRLAEGPPCNILEILKKKWRHQVVHFRLQSLRHSPFPY